MITFQDRLEALLQELPDTDALEESQLKKASRFKITFPYRRDTDPNVPIDDTLRNVVDAMRNMFPQMRACPTMTTELKTRYLPTMANWPML